MENVVIDCGNDFVILIEDGMLAIDCQHCCGTTLKDISTVDSIIQLLQKYKETVVNAT